MANFHETLVLNKYLLSLFGIDSIGKKIIGKNGVELFPELKLSTNEGYTDEGNTIYLQSLLNHLYQTEQLNKDMLRAYDDNIVRFTKEISEDRLEMITWKYFQYLSLLFTEVYLDKYFSNKSKLLAELNQYVKEFNHKQADPSYLRKKKEKDVFIAKPFTLDALNKLAFWNATGSGKTLIMHINIKQYMHYTQKYNQQLQNKVLLITPNEGLSKQHLEEFKLSNIQANIFNKDALMMFSGKEVEILEITKLADVSGDKRVAVDSFETDNLVLIDEGHGGMGGEKWKPYRDQLSETGFAFEYSATFGQAINAISNKKDKEEFMQEYAKSILFDYSYKYFYEDGYGKDYRILNLKEDDKEYQNVYLTANLISFFQQQLIFKEKGNQLKNFLLHKPLWVFVGGRVNAVRRENGKDVSDVLEIIYFLTEFLKNSQKSIKHIESILQNKAGLVDKNGFSIFETSFSYLIDKNISAEDVLTGINELVFNNTTLGANLYLDNLVGADGELGLRVGEADYFGVINVGDEKKLYNLAVDNGVLGGERDFSSSLFKKINEDDSTINLLIGSKKFTEGWSSWRVSSMGLMNVGKSEGSQIIQLFGRGVRLKGYNFSLKRSTGLDDYQKPDNVRIVKPWLRHLETLQIFGIQANYMEQFKEFLEEEGLPTNDSSWISIKIPTEKKKVVNERKLNLIRVKDSDDFKRKELIKLQLNLKLFNGRLAELDMYPKIDILQTQKSGVELHKYNASFQSNHLELLDWNKLYLDMQNYKSDKSYSNLSIAIDDLKEILINVSWYNLLVPAHKMSFNSFGNVFLWQEIAEMLLKKYIDQFYLFYKNQFHSEHIEAVVLNESDDNFISEYNFRLNSSEDIKQYQNKIEELKEEVLKPTFKQIQIASEASAFDNALHLYKPLVYIGKNYENLIKVSPIALDESEKQFLDDLFKYVTNNSEKLKNKEVHVLRNQSRKGIGFFTEGNNFYPDFILWVVVGDKQYIKFIDPKGIRNSRAMNDPKIQFHKVIKEIIQPQVESQGIILDSYIVSNTSYLEVNWKNKFEIKDFNDQNVFFQKENATTYIESILD